MDPVQKVWLFENWLEDQNNRTELAKNHAYLLASFSHPEAVKKLVGDDNQIELSDEELEDSWGIVKNFDKKEKKKRRRKLRN